MSHHSLSAGQRNGKVWGTTQCLFSGENSEFHIIEAKKGGYCSKHKHLHKYNRFFVLSGKLEITCWNSTEDKTILGPNEYTDVPPGVSHRFKALEDTICFEVYWTEKITTDIVREDNGGME